MPCPPSLFSKLIIFKSRSMIIGQSTCCMMSFGICRSCLRSIFTHSSKHFCEIPAFPTASIPVYEREDSRTTKRRTVELIQDLYLRNGSKGAVGLFLGIPCIVGQIKDNPEIFV